MLIICSGPDTFRALKKAKELESAFKQKYDAQGLSVERISSGKEAVTEIAARAGALNLFAPRRFVRTANLLAETSKGQRANLKRSLAGDQEGFIVLSVEEEPPAATVLKELEPEIKTVRYDFSSLQGQSFFTWAKEEGRTMGLLDERAIREIVQLTEGDSWSCFFELMKRAAFFGAETANQNGGAGTVFEFADAYVAGRRQWWEITHQTDLMKQVVTTFLSQARAGLRVRDGATDGLHPFIARKLRNQKLDYIEEVFARAAEGFFLQRSGYGNEEEVIGVL